MFSVFARPKPCRIMVTLRNSEEPLHLSKIAKGTDTTYVYVTHLVSKLAEEGYVSVEARGKKRMVRLTEKGTRVANAIEELNKWLSE